jgi:hypothetical protein
MADAVFPAACGRCESCARSKPMFCEQGIGTGIQISGGQAEYMGAYADAGDHDQQLNFPFLCQTCIKKARNNLETLPARLLRRGSRS